MPISLSTAGACDVAVPVTATHCPYCALQCGMTVAGARRSRSPHARTSRPTRAVCARRAGPPAELLDQRRTAHHPAARTARPVGWDDALDFVADRIRARPGRARPRRRRRVRRRRADQREGLPARQVRPRRAAHQRRSTTTAGSACRRPPRPATARSASTAACRSRSPTSPQADAVLLVGRQRRRDHAAVRAAPHRAARARRRADRRRPAPHRHRPAGATLHLQLTPGTDLALALGLLHIVDRRRPRRTRPTSPTGPTASTRSGPSAAAWWPERVERITGVPVAPDARRTAASARRRGRGRSILTARGAEQHAKGTDTVTAFINLALALGLPGRAGLRLRLRHRPGQRPGRPRARAEGRPAARLPEDRRSRPRGPTSPPSGASTPDDLPGPRPLRLRTARRARHPRRAAGRCWCSARNPVGLRAAGRARRRAARLRWTCSSSSDLVLSRDRRAGRRRAAHHPVGRGETAR